jgi:hypothetical protein
MIFFQQLKRFLFLACRALCNDFSPANNFIDSYNGGSDANLMGNWDDDSHQEQVQQQS